MEMARDGGEPERLEEGQGGCRGGLVEFGGSFLERHEFHFRDRIDRRLKFSQCVKFLEAGFFCGDIGQVWVRQRNDIRSGKEKIFALHRRRR
jgi:hypothetical protein